MIDITFCEIPSRCSCDGGFNGRGLAALPGCIFQGRSHFHPAQHRNLVESWVFFVESFENPFRGGLVRLALHASRLLRDRDGVCPALGNSAAVRGARV
jgi:hypothetical protein